MMKLLAAVTVLAVSTAHADADYPSSA